MNAIIARNKISTAIIPNKPNKIDFNAFNKYGPQLVHFGIAFNIIV